MDFSTLVASLPATVPFVAPEALERRMGRPLRARLGANESSFGMSPKALEAMRMASQESWMYGDPESLELRHALAQKHGVDPDQIRVASGIDDFLGLIARAFIEPGVPVAASLGSYPTFHFHVLGFGGTQNLVPYRNFTNDLDALTQTPGRLVYLSNPDNPTGHWYSAAEIEAFERMLPNGSVLVLDEAYADFAPETPSFDPEGRVIRLRTFSKAYGLAGARIGYAIGSREVMRTFDKIRHHFGVSRAAQAGALASLQDQDFLGAVINQVRSGREEYVRLGLTALPSHTNFVAFDVGTADRSQAIVEGLLARGVFIRRPNAPGLDCLIRISVGQTHERQILTEALRDLPN